MLLLTRCCVVLLVFLITFPVEADILDFEGLSSLEVVTTQFPGLTFGNTITLTAGISLNEIDFPPQSGVNVVSDDGGPITILFSTPGLWFSGYFTYVTPLSLEAFNASDVSVALAGSLFSSNDGFTGVPGSSPNELIGVSPAGGFSKIVITGDAFGSSFVMDDASYSTVPEPATFPILFLALSALVYQSRRRTKHY